ncbi:hypothetical protein D3C73_1304880 [compost metagenome]
MQALVDIQRPIAGACARNHEEQRDVETRSVNGIQRAAHDIVDGQYRGGNIGKVGVIKGNDRAGGMEAI